MRLTFRIAWVAKNWNFMKASHDSELDKNVYPCGIAEIFKRFAIKCLPISTLSSFYDEKFAIIQPVKRDHLLFVLLYWLITHLKPNQSQVTLSQFAWWIWRFFWITLWLKIFWNSFSYRMNSEKPLHFCLDYLETVLAVSI